MSTENKMDDRKVKFLNGRLSKFILNDYQREQAISLFKHGVSTADIFRIISDKKGVPKSHVSGKYKEGKLKNS